jgi:hypothetical protein
LATLPFREPTPVLVEHARHFVGCGNKRCMMKPSLHGGRPMIALIQAPAEIRRRLQERYRPENKEFVEEGRRMGCDRFPAWVDVEVTCERL